MKETAKPHWWSAPASSFAAILAAWPNVTVDCSSTAPFTAPINDQITSFPNAVLDLQNGKIADAYYGNSGVSEDSYVIGTPADLSPCDDIYITPMGDDMTVYANVARSNDPMQSAKFSSNVYYTQIFDGTAGGRTLSCSVTASACALN